MSYQVIARRYRPQKFEEVVGQEHITQTLKNAIESNRVHHAYLFAGARGIGKTTVARILAKAFNCEKGPTAEPCGECAQCKEIVIGNSLDVQEIDGASNTGVDDVREIREHAKYMPAKGRYKIYIIDEVHMLSTPAFNALLKILEEPPPHVIFMFATTEPHKIPVTILSRCQRYDFRRIPSAKIVQLLSTISKAEGIAIDENSLSLIAHEATGSMRDAESLLDQAIAFSGKKIDVHSIESMLGFLDRKLVFDLADAVINKDGKLALEKLNEFFEMGVDLVRFTMDFLSVLRDLLVVKECGPDESLFDLPRDELEILNKLSSKISIEELHQIFQIWYSRADAVARSSYPKMLLEVLLMRLIRIEPVKSISEILESIESITGQGGVNCNTAKGSLDDREPSNISSGETNNWSGFISWLANERPQIASILEHGKCIKIENGVVDLTFESPFYAAMLGEVGRKAQIEQLLNKFFKRSLAVSVETIGGKEDSKPQKGNDTEAYKSKKVLVKEALESDIVREAANILDAKVHDVVTNLKDS